MDFSVRKPLRLGGYDYSKNGCYFVTICTLKRIYYFGEIEKFNDTGDVMARNLRDGTVKNARDGTVKTVPYMKLSKCGEIAETEILNIAKYHHGLAYIDKYTVMPNHLHLLLVLDPTYVGDGLDRPVPVCDHSPSVPKIIGLFKSGVTRKCNIADISMFWQRSYHDHIIRNDAEYQRIWQYIDTNPENWETDELYKEK